MCFTLLVFIFQNIKLYPYNYIWLNNFNYFYNVGKNFELDYWGVSTKNIAKFLNTQNSNSTSCIISNRNNGIKFFIEDKNKCFKTFDNLHKKNKRPFYVALSERAVKKGVPNRCDLLFEEKINMNFSSENLVLAKVFKCN